MRFLRNLWRKPGVQTVVIGGAAAVLFEMVALIARWLATGVTTARHYPMRAGVP